MPVHALPYILSSGSSISLIHPRIALAVFAAFIALLLRRWAAGKDLIARLHIRDQEEEREREREYEARKARGLAGDDDDAAASRRVGKSSERDLHGTTFLVACNVVSASSLLVLSALSSRGAQLILLLPSSAFAEGNLSATLQYTQLLRDGTNNEQVFAEECDLLDLKSIDEFCKKWNDRGEDGEKQQHSSHADPSQRQRQSPRRVDGLVFLPYQAHELRVRGKSLDDELLGKFHLINSLLATLLLLPPGRDIRIVNWVSPWYAAGVEGFLSEQKRVVEEQRQGKQPSRKGSQMGARRGQTDASRSQTDASTTASRPPQPPSTASLGSTTLTTLLLTFELQRRLILLAEADTRPRNPLPGILDNRETPISSVDQLLPRSSASRNYPNVNVVNICPGFERDGEVAQWLWPRQRRGGSNAFWSLLTCLRTIVIAICVYPFLFLIAKSPKAAAEHFVWGIVAPLNAKSGTESLLAEVDGFEELRRQGGDNNENTATSSSSASASASASASVSSPSSPSPASPSTSPPPTSLAWAREPAEDQAGWKGIQPARLYREGAIVRLPSAIGAEWYKKETLAELWSDWEAKVERVEGGLRRAGGGGGGKKSP